MNLWEEADRLSSRSRALVQYFKRGGKEQRLALIAVLCLGLAGILASDYWLQFLAPLKTLLGAYWAWINLLPVLLGVIAIGWLILLHLKRAPSAALPESLTPSVIKGPSSFGPQDGEFFQKLGRKNELRTILAYIEDPQIPMIVVMGDSGAGKTSLLRSGLNYLCEKRKIPLIYWEAVANEPVAKLVETINRSWPSQLKVLEEILLSAGERQAIIVLDQFEQLDRNNSQARRIFRVLAEASRKPGPHNITWIIAFQRDYDPEWRDFELENPGIRMAMLSLKLFNEKQARQVMATLAEESGFTLDEALLRDIINSVRSKKGISPVDIAISILMLDTLARDKADAHLTISDYKFAGGAGGILTAYLSSQLERLPSANREELLKVLLKLADLTTNKRIAEGRSLSELRKATTMPVRLFESELDRLSSPRVRLLECFQPSTSANEKIYRLPHERLIESLRELTGNFLAAAEKAHLAFESSFSIWNSNRQRQYLLNGKDLREISKFVSQFNWADDEAKRLFLRQSKSKQNKRRLAITAFTLMLISGGYFGVQQYNAYRINQIKRDLNQWGLPTDLFEYQQQLKNLSVKDEQLTNTTWIAHNVDELTLESPGLAAIGPLPSSITSLTLAGPVSDLSGITNLVNLTTLDLRGCPQLSSLSGIEKLQNLETLYLGSVRSRSLAGLEKLPKLTHLELGFIGNAFDLDNLDKLNNLTTLSLRRSRYLKSLTSIEKLRKLTTLDISYNPQLASFVSLEKLSNLSSLDISGNPQADIASLAKLPNLTTLIWADAEITNLAGIKALKNLTALTVSYNLNLISLEGIENLPNLTTLILAQTGLRNLSSIKKLPQLKTLYLNFNEDLVALDGVENLPNLTTLYLSRNPELTNFTGIESLKKLTTLDLSYSRITGLNAIETLPELTSLDLSYSAITSLAGIERLSQLTTLDASGTSELRDFTELGHLPNLRSLNVSYNRSIIGLLRIEEKLPNLTTLDLSYTNVEKIDGLEKLVNLTTLNLSGTHLQNLGSLQNCPKLKTIEMYKLDLKTLKGLPKSVEQLALGSL